MDAVTEPTSAAEPAALLRALADPDRLRAFAAVLLGGGAAADVAAASGLRPRETVEALARLEAVGLVRRGGGGWSAAPERLQAAAAAVAPERPVVDHGAGGGGEEAVLRTFLPDGRIAQLPAQETKRRIVLDHVCRVFEPGHRYPERDVNALLRAFTDDYVTVRR